jgi:hypothetical protein
MSASIRPDQTVLLLAQQNWKTVVNLPGVDVSGLSPLKTRALLRLRMRHEGSRVPHQGPAIAILSITFFKPLSQVPKLSDFEIRFRRCQQSPLSF